MVLNPRDIYRSQQVELASHSDKENHLQWNNDAKKRKLLTLTSDRFRCPVVILISFSYLKLLRLNYSQTRVILV